MRYNAVPHGVWVQCKTLTFNVLELLPHCTLNLGINANSSVDIAINSKEREEKTMARKPMVTRELIGTSATVLTVKVSTEQTDTVTLNIKGNYKTPENLLKALKKAYETDDFRLLKVVDFQPTRKLYGLPENQFFSEAVELDPETRKPLSE